jgi:hypothetical protein
MPKTALDPELIPLWRMNPTTGYWELARQCAVINASHWLHVLQRDEPNVQFVLSRRKPKLPK